jgi:ribose transport system ATP-binding protein
VVVRIRGLREGVTVSQSSTEQPVLEVRQLSKAFPGVQALKEVSLRLQRSEILALIGENGAGKSTLLKILGGVQRPDSGESLLDGRPVHLNGVDAAERLGIALIHQELNLADNLDVAGNIFLGREPRWGGPLRLLDRRIYADAERIMRRVGLDGSPRTLVGQLPVGQQQLVEIARALSLQSRILIMDEPTSSLTQHEADRLFPIIRDLKAQGVSIIYVSHRLKEVEALADRVVVLRDGANAGELGREAIRHEAMVRLMVGRELKQFYQRTPHAPAPGPPPLVRVEGLRLRPGRGRPIAFALHAGEIVGMAGLMGSGRTELAEALFGIEPPVAGEVFLNGMRTRIEGPTQAIAAGVLLVPEDRRLQGLILSESVQENIGLPSLEQLSRWHLVSRRRERELARELCGRLNVRTPSVQQTVGLLSGGNQQKVVLAKWLARSPRLLILDEPTRGVDIGAKTEIYALMDRLAQQGVAVLMISSDLEEILGMSDRVLVMHEGALAGELGRAEMTEEAIMHLATGGE